MKALDQFSSNRIQFVFTDIDDTLTKDGQIESPAFEALWKLSEKGIFVVPVTGRPAGWCEMIARTWPVAGVIGENGGFYFRYHQKKMLRHFSQTEAVRKENQKKLESIKNEVLSSVPGSAIASDQFCRIIDLAVDFCEDVPALKKDDIKKIVEVFESYGATAKVSSIHVNGWFGDHDKLTMCRDFLSKEFSLNLDNIQQDVVFVGDSPNDAPMFDAFENSFGVANVKDWESEIKTLPKFISTRAGGEGFAEIANRILEIHKS